MYVCMCVCVCMYVCMYVRRCWWLHPLVYISMCRHTCGELALIHGICIYIQTNAHTCKQRSTQRTLNDFEMWEIERHTCIDQHIHTCTHIYMHTYIHTYIHIHWNVHTYIHTESLECVWDVGKRSHTCMNAHIHTCTHTCIHTYMNTFIRTYVHTYRESWMIRLTR